MKFETASIHTGQNFSTETGAVIPPVFLTSTFASGNNEKFDYTRSGNPNFRNLENTISALENAQYSTVFSSGVAAITAICSTLKKGDTILAEENLYGCTIRLFRDILEKFGIKIEYVDFTNERNYSKIIGKTPTLVWIESPTNPLLKIIDIKKISQLAHKVNAVLVVDNTFASSYLQNPLSLGADLSLLSTTKYMSGHSDVLGGSVSTNSKKWEEKLKFAQKALGLSPSPFDCFLISRGIKTLALRMEKHSKNALKVAKFLKNHPAISTVSYPFLDETESSSIAKKQMKAGSGIVSAQIKGNLSSDEVKKILSSLRFFTLAESLGGIESLCCHPYTMTHASVEDKKKQEIGITPQLIRLSVGIENADDLISDLNKGLSLVNKK